MNRAPILLRFYKSLLAASLIPTVMCLYLFATQGPDLLYALLLLKLVLLPLTLAYIAAYRRKELFYYYNLSCTKNHLWGAYAFLDLLVLGISLSLIAVVR